MNPPMPIRFIHKRSFAIPSFVILPFIQCHHTSGFEATGGLMKPFNNSSLLSCAVALKLKKTRRNKQGRRNLNLFIIIA
jgi:hypothetical protein